MTRITTDMLQSQSITVDKIADNSVNGDKIEDNSITYQDISDGDGSGLDSDTLDGPRHNLFCNSLAHPTTLGTIQPKTEVDGLVSDLNNRIAALEAKLARLTVSHGWQPDIHHRSQSACAQR